MKKLLLLAAIFAGFAVSAEAVTVNYTLHCTANNADYTGSYETDWNGASTALPTFTGANGYSLSGAQFTQSGETYTMTANITFPFPVSSAGYLNPTGMQSLLSNNFGGYFKLYDSNNTLKATTNAVTYAAQQSFRWYLYPTLTNGVFSFKIQNQGSGKFIPAASGNLVEEASAGSYYYVLSQTGYNGFCTTNVNSTNGGVFLSMNSSGSADAAISWWTRNKATHAGANIQFIEIPEIDLGGANNEVRNGIVMVLTGSGLFTTEEINTIAPEGKEYFTEDSTSTDVTGKITEELNNIMVQVRTKLTGKKVYIRAKVTGNDSDYGALTIKPSADGSTYESRHCTDLTIGSFWEVAFTTDNRIILKNLYYGKYLKWNGTEGYGWWDNNEQSLAFDFSPAYDGSFYLKNEVSGNGINKAAKEKLCSWPAGAGNGGSHWKVYIAETEIANFSTALMATAPANTEALHVNTTNGIDDALAAAVEALTADKTDIEAYKNLEAAIANTDVVTFNPDYFYHIKSVGRSNFNYAYIHESDGLLAGKLNDAASTPFSFMKFTPIMVDDDATPSVQKYNIECNGGVLGALANSGQAGLYEVKGEAAPGKYYIEHDAQGKHWIIDMDVTQLNTNNTLMNKLHANNNNVQNMSDWEDTSKWYIEVAQKVNVNLNMSDGNYNYGVGYFPFPVAVDPDDSSELMLLYIGFDKDTQKPVLSYNVPSIVPANVAFLVRNSGSSKANLAIAYAAPAMIDDEDAPTYLLSGSLRSTTAQAGDYTVGITDNGLGFVKQTAAPTVASNSIYLPAEALQSSAKHLAEDVLLLNTPEKTSGISNIQTLEHSNTIYDLQGRKLAAPVKGINIIGGRKVLVK